ncbi:MAG TPA: hypothetical protein VHU23_12350 [Rhizomicrobium sp.]|jgi:hypothetical protein|nr:hypothetical protein [Rhizomicrobium sp.]
MTHKVKRLYINETEVEQRFIYPLLTSPGFLEIDADAIQPKSYLAPTQLDKDAGRKSGYFPDYSIWISGQPVLIVEAKDPIIQSQTGFREACLYARHFNSRFKTGVNPCKFVIATNGVNLLAGYWDQETPVLELNVSDLKVGTKQTQRLVDFCGNSILENHATAFRARFGTSRGVKPATMVGDQALLNAKRPLNSFAADLSPILRRYFSSTDDESNREIAAKAYVSSAETTEYDHVLEALLKDRSSPRRDSIVQSIHTSKNEERILTKAIQSFHSGKTHQGQLQIIQGGVGSGKSLFARRYRDLLEPQGLKASNIWSFIDFNASPPSLKGAERWLAERFIEGIERENPALPLYETEVQKGIFARRIQQRKAYYELLRKASSEQENLGRAKDLAEWQNDVIGLAEGFAQYVTSINKSLVVVLDNVDKLDLQSQLDAFQLALWFMQKSRAFTILQMRDETYERYKNKPPLDTFRSGIAFYIAPPRFIDVVKRRLELGIAFLAKEDQSDREYVLDSGARVVLPPGELGGFLQELYLTLFGRRANVARVLEALSGRDVRKALEMFVSIVTSGHLSTSAITSAARGEGEVAIGEFHILRILMRTDYRFFSDQSGYTSNIFHYENTWTKPDNFILVEILYFLAMNRKRVGEIGLEGYFSVKRICNEIQKFGYDRGDIFSAVNYLLSRQLIIADNFSTTEVDLNDSVKVRAAGFMHLRVLCERIEYLYGVIVVTPITNETVYTQLAEYVGRENTRGNISATEKTRAVEIFLGFLEEEFKRVRKDNPIIDDQLSGANYILGRMQSSVKRFFDHTTHSTTDRNELDLA